MTDVFIVDGEESRTTSSMSFERPKQVAQQAPECQGRAVGLQPIWKHQLVGGSSPFRHVAERARQAARTDANILIEAETGAGKEVLARFIHGNSARRGRPFVAVNCAVYPEPVLEAELFGHMQGGLKGAMATRPGKFELADGGTLLLDEIGEIPQSLQPKLLRVFQERAVGHVGHTQRAPLDVRVIATTNRCLRGLVQEGRFRSDLYHRISVIPLEIPPLRDHREDVAELAKHFVRKYARDSRGTAPQLTPDLLAWMEAYDWPGNVRELQIFIQRVLAVSSSPAVGLEVLERIEFTPSSLRPLTLEAGLTLRAVERQLLERTLEATGGNRTRAAGILGISLRTIRNKIRLYGLPPREAP